jgi:hypothetical protein
VGLGPERASWEDYEWFDPHSVVSADDSYLQAGLESLRRDPLWLPGTSTRVLLVDLDNLRVESVRLKARLAMTVALAREADHVAFAGQEGSVRRARGDLAEFEDRAVVVGNGSDEADEALLAVASDVADDDVQFIVVSNDNIFARLAMRGPLTVLSPGLQSLSDRLAEAAERVLDMAVIEATVTAVRAAPPQPRQRSRSTVSSRR